MDLIGMPFPITTFTAAVDTTWRQSALTTRRRVRVDYSARRIALYTASQCDETSARARAVVSATVSRRLITASTSLMRVSRTLSRSAMVLTSCAITSLSLLGSIVARQV